MGDSKENSSGKMSDYAIGYLTMIKGIKGVMGDKVAASSIASQLSQNKITEDEANYIRGKIGL